MVVIPIIYITPKQANATFPFVLVDLQHNIFLSRNDILGFLDKVDRDICEITTNLASEHLSLEVTSEQPEKI